MSSTAAFKPLQAVAAKCDIAEIVRILASAEAESRQQRKQTERHEAADRAHGPRHALSAAIAHNGTEAHRPAHVACRTKANTDNT
jgi:hypothetical protein